MWPAVDIDLGIDQIVVTKDGNRIAGLCRKRGMRDDVRNRLQRGQDAVTTRRVSSVDNLLAGVESKDLRLNSPAHQVCHGTEWLSGCGSSLQSVDRRLQLVDSEEETFVKQAKLIKGDAVDVSLPEESAISRTCRPHAVDIVANGLARTLDVRDLPKPPGISEIAPDAFHSGQLRRIGFRNGRPHPPIRIPPLVFETITAISRHAIQRFAQSPF
jgi:hypothetical protein